MSLEEVEKWWVGQPNKSAVFILPMLGTRCREFHGNFLPQMQFRNCFIGDKTKYVKDKILLLYRFDADPSYLKFENELENHPLFLDRYEADKKHTMFVFRVPDGSIEDYFKIIKGEYSKIDNNLKIHILDFHGLKEFSNTGGVLYKTSNKREALEAIINEGLPRRQMVSIPNDVELEEPFNEEIEYFQDKYKYKSTLSPEEEFNS